MYAAKSFEQPPRRRSSPAPNRNPLQPLLELLVGARYIAPQNAAPAPLQPRYSYQSRTTFVPKPFPSISLHLRTLRVFTKKHPGWHTLSFFSLLRNSRSALNPKRSSPRPVTRNSAPPLSSILPAPALRASKAILPRERGFS